MREFQSFPLQTGDSLSGGKVTYRLSFPNQIWFLQAIMAALITMAPPENWNDVGLITPAEASQLAIDMIEDFMILPDLTGCVIPFAGPVLPAGALKCDGSSYLRSDYPYLFVAIGTIYGAVDADHFSVPDLVQRAVIGTGGGMVLGDEIGEATHMLITAEMPSHTHTDVGHTHLEVTAIGNLTTIGPGAPEPTALPSVGTTGTGNASLTNTGGDGAHNNIQPSTALNWAIITGQ
jgi:microcystin-dependent protein